MGSPVRAYDFLLKFLLVGDSDVGKGEILASLQDGATESPYGYNLGKPRHLSKFSRCRRVPLLLRTVAHLLRRPVALQAFGILDRGGAVAAQEAKPTARCCQLLGLGNQCSWSSR